jgi:surfeit locus 1 family protein
MTGPRRTRPAGARLLAAACAALLCAGFVALGTWQLQRLQWKTALIAQVDQRVHAAPAAAPALAEWGRLSKERDEYRHVRLRGHFLDTPATLVQATTELGSGFWVLAPFGSEDGAIVMVNRGFVPASAKRTGASSAAGAEVTGLLRMSEPGGGFLRNNDPLHQRWYSRDVQAIAAARGLPRVAPYFVDQDGAQADPARPSPGSAAVAPVGGLTVVSFNNNHLVYALTWFAMALMAAGACVFVVRERGPQ